MQEQMRYSFDLCSLFGDVFISDDNKACAPIVYPDKKSYAKINTVGHNV